MTPYNKPHLSYQNQIDLLKSRGLIINTEDFAITKLKHISYFRLSAYFLPFQTVKDTFDPGTTFEQVIPQRRHTKRDGTIQRDLYQTFP